MQIDTAHRSTTDKGSGIHRSFYNHVHAIALMDDRFSNLCVSVIPGVFTFVALSFYFEACIFNIVFLKYLFIEWCDY